MFLADFACELIIAIIAIALFIWPLLGIHRLLVSEKEKLVAASAKRIETDIAEFDRCIDAGELEAMDKMKATMDGSGHQADVHRHIPTWPWSRNTYRLVATAIALPIILYAIQRLIEVILHP